MESEHYKAQRENFKITFDLAGEYAKWLVSSLMLLHSGAIAGLFHKDSLWKQKYAAIFFGFGLLLALLTGIFGWFNLQTAARHYRDSSEALNRRRPEPKRPKSIRVLRYVAILLLFGSVACLAVGAAILGFKSLV